MTELVADPDVVTKSRFAALANVSPPRVSQWISEGKLAGDALVGEGRSAKVRVSVARVQLKRTLDISQRLGNGITTRLDGPELLAPAPSSAPPAPSPGAPQPQLDTVEDHLKREKLDQLLRANRKAAREEAESIGRLTDSTTAAQEIGRAVKQTVVIFEGAIPEIASKLAATYNLPQRDLVHLLKMEHRRIRETAVKALRRSIQEIPALASVEVDEVGADPEPPEAEIESSV